jgi:hypothetical protein
MNRSSPSVEKEGVWLPLLSKPEELLEAIAELALGRPERLLGGMYRQWGSSGSNSLEVYLHLRCMTTFIRITFAMEQVAAL